MALAFLEECKKIGEKKEYWNVFCISLLSLLYGLIVRTSLEWEKYKPGITVSKNFVLRNQEGLEGPGLTYCHYIYSALRSSYNKFFSSDFKETLQGVINEFKFTFTFAIESVFTVLTTFIVEVELTILLN